MVVLPSSERWFTVGYNRVSVLGVVVIHTAWSMSVVLCVGDANRDLDNNQLTTLPEGIFDSLTSLIQM